MRFLFLLAATSALAQPHQVVPDNLRHLMLDSRVVYRSVNAKLALGQVVKDKRNPLMQADKPWENATNNLYPNVLWDEQDQVFKIWYKCVLADKDVIAKMDGPSTIHDVGWYLLYATSKDGITWDKPELGLHKFDGDSRNNIVARDTPNAGVFKDTHDPDSARRYKMVYDVGLGEPRVRFSADGMHWGEPIKAEGFSKQHGDTHNNAFWDERNGKYVWITKLYLGERTIARFESDDFIHWKGGEMVLRSTIEEGRAHQTYAMPAFRMANLYLGYTMMYHVGSGRTVDCELAWSPDGQRWQRVAPGVTFIPSGAAGSYDAGCVYAMAGPAVAEGNELLLFYGGDHVPHLGWKRSCLPCLARLPVDHFAGYEQIDKSQPASLFTAQFTVTEEPLRITADAAGGQLSIAALDELGVTVDDVIDIKDNVIAQEVKWRHQGLAKYKGTRMHLQFELSGGAKLYSFSGLEMVNTELREPLNPLRSPYRKVAPINTRTVGFETDSQGWKGVDKVEHHATGGAQGGYLTVSRSSRSLPIAFSPAKVGESPFAGDWSQLFGGKGATIRVQTRAAKTAGKVRIEIFAGDVAQWYHESSQPFSPEWTAHSAELRYSWSDAEATQAGWVRAANGFSWADTITHVGKVVITSGVAGALESFDLDEVSVTGE